MKPCDLCALPVGERPFVLEVAGKRLEFCCEGCRGIYQMIHDLRDNSESLPDPPSSLPSPQIRRTP